MEEVFQGGTVEHAEQNTVHPLAPARIRWTFRPSPHGPRDPAGSRHEHDEIRPGLVRSVCEIHGIGTSMALEGKCMQKETNFDDLRLVSSRLSSFPFEENALL